MQYVSDVTVNEFDTIVGHIREGIDALLAVVAHRNHRAAKPNSVMTLYTSHLRKLMEKLAMSVRTEYSRSLATAMDAPTELQRSKVTDAVRTLIQVNYFYSEHTFIIRIVPPSREPTIEHQKK